MTAEIIDLITHELVCRHCGKTPQDIGWCEECGYNRQYEEIVARVCPICRQPGGHRWNCSTLTAGQRGGN